MNVKIYGKSKGCKFCDTAKQICEANNFSTEFIDIVDCDISAEKLSEICGVPVKQVPQIFVDGSYVGGCDKFIELLKAK